MKILKHSRVFFLLFLILSCSSIKVKKITNISKIDRKIETVSIVGKNENIIHGGKKVGDFVLKESPVFVENMFDIDWNDMKNKMKDLAISSGANLIEINAIGNGIKGHTFYADGSFFYVENLKSINKETKPCLIVVLRDGFESPLGSAFKINVQIDSGESERIKKDNYAKMEFENCYRNVKLTVNKDSFDIKLNGESKYFKVSKQTSGNSTNGAIQIGVGDVQIVEMKDKDLGRLMMYQN